MADPGSGGPWEWRTLGVADRNPDASVPLPVTDYVLVYFGFVLFNVAK